MKKHVSGTDAALPVDTANCLTGATPPLNLNVEYFNNVSLMATVNFSVPNDIKNRFNKTFKGRNKSAILSRLMEQAIDQEEQRKRRIKAIDQLLKLQASVGSKPVSDDDIRKARQRGRP